MPKPIIAPAPPTERWVSALRTSTHPTEIDLICPIYRITCTVTDDCLSPTLRARRHLLLYRRVGGTIPALAGGSYRSAARLFSAGQSCSSFRNCRHCHLAGPSAFGLDVARGRQRLLNSLATNQIRLFPRPAVRGTHLRESLNESRTWDLATAFLGTHRSRRG